MNGATQILRNGMEQGSIEPVDRAPIVFCRSLECLVVFLEALNEKIDNFQKALRMQNRQELGEPV